MGKVIGFFSAAGGVGKTTISLILGYFLRKSGKRVLMMDMDPSVCLSLYVLKEDRVVDLMDRGRTISTVIERIGRREEVRPGDFIEQGLVGGVYLDVIASDSRLAEVIDHIWHGPRAAREYLSRNVLRDSGLIERYDFVILDTIPFYDKKYTILTIHASDRYVIPLRPTIVDTYRTSVMLRELPMIASMEDKVIYGKTSLVFNMVKEGSRQTDEISKYGELFLEKFPGVRVFKNYLRNLVGFSRFSTEEEIPEDRKRVEREFNPLFEEFNYFLCSAREL